MSTPDATSRIQLPAVKVFKQVLGHAEAWSDHYGALQVAADYCDITFKFLTFKGVWQHGCFGPWDNSMPHQLAYHAPEAESCPVYVARGDQEAVLRGHGFGQAQAIGLPFAYLPEVRVERRGGSLLVVPIHTLKGIPFESTRECDEYADFIKSISGHFSEVAVCVHAGCLDNGYWFKQFSERGIECVVGARTDDANALLRMKTLFSQFEHVTTNGWGSHVAYALHCGAQLSIHGPVPRRDRDGILRDLGWGGDAEAVAKFFSRELQEEKDKCLSKFYLHPYHGIGDVEFGRWLIGMDHRLSPRDLKSRFGWSCPDRLRAFFSREGYWLGGRCEAMN